jgi:hypothetical protein
MPRLCALLWIDCADSEERLGGLEDTMLHVGSRIRRYFVVRIGPRANSTGVSTRGNWSLFRALTACFVTLITYGSSSRSSSNKAQRSALGNGRSWMTIAQHCRRRLLDDRLPRQTRRPRHRLRLFCVVHCVPRPSFLFPPSPTRSLPPEAGSVHRAHLRPTYTRRNRRLSSSTIDSVAC